MRLNGVILLYLSATATFGEFVTPPITYTEASLRYINESYHGLEVLFHRKVRIERFKIKYAHKAIVVYPKLIKMPRISIDSSGKPIDPVQPYVIHLWNSGVSKRHSTIRLDPFAKVILGDPFDIVQDRPGALPIDEAVSRAAGHLGLIGFSGLKYDLLGNNCGNFVAWAKYGDPNLDNQIWDRLDEISNSLGFTLGPHLVESLAKRMKRRYGAVEVVRV